MAELDYIATHDSFRIHILFKSSCFHIKGMKEERFRMDGAFAPDAKIKKKITI
jgi:hypothetical protein